MAEAGQHQEADPVEDKTDEERCYEHDVSAQQTVITADLIITRFDGDERHVALWIAHWCSHRVMDRRRRRRVQHRRNR